MESSEVLNASSIRDGLYVIPVIEISESSEDESENANQNLHTRDISDCENSESKTPMEYLNQTEANNANGNKISLTKAPVDSSFHTNLFDEFLNECKKYFKFPQDDKIVEKIKKYFEAVDADYKLSPQCISLLKMFTQQLEQRRSDIYIFIKEVLDEFKIHKEPVKVKSDVPVKPERIRKLEKYLEVSTT